MFVLFMSLSHGYWSSMNFWASFFPTESAWIEGRSVTPLVGFARCDQADGFAAAASATRTPPGHRRSPWCR